MGLPARSREQIGHVKLERDVAAPHPGIIAEFGDARFIISTRRSWGRYIIPSRVVNIVVPLTWHEFGLEAR
jgi:hypothetical protein